jgi:hypothetical protein
MSLEAEAKDPRLAAAVELVGRTGATSIGLRYQDDEQPVVWVAVAQYGERYEAAGALTPLKAAIRLLEIIIDGGECQHCHRPFAVSDDWSQSMPLEEAVCWYVYDPETQKFRRGCEGDN